MNITYNSGKARLHLIRTQRPVDKTQSPTHGHGKKRTLKAVSPKLTAESGFSLLVENFSFSGKSPRQGRGQRKNQFSPALTYPRSRRKIRNGPFFFFADGILLIPCMADTVLSLRTLVSTVAIMRLHVWKSHGFLCLEMHGFGCSPKQSGKVDRCS